MLREVKTLHGATIHALDGEIGKVDEILFDDEHWTVRYLVVDTGGWLSGRKVLVSMLAFGSPDWEQQAFSVNLTREQIRNSPGVETDRPVSRQWERGYYDYYSWPYYWGGMGWWGDYWYPDGLAAEPAHHARTAQQRADERAQNHASAHLRSTKEVTGYGITATDGHLGHVQDFILNEETWQIRYLAVDTRDWLPGKRVLLPPDWIDQVNWPDQSVMVTVTRDQVRNAPEWDPGQPISSAFEDQLYRYYARQRPRERQRSKIEAKEVSVIAEPVARREIQLNTSEQAGMPEKSAVVAVYDTHTEAETAIRELQKLGFDMTKLSIVGKDYQVNEEVVGYYTTGDRMMSWGKSGAFWGGMWSLLFGSAFFLVPGIGALLAAGPVVAWIVGALESAVVVGGVSALGAALFSIGIPNDSIVAYETQIKSGKFVVIAHDVEGSLDKAMIALEATRHQGVTQHALHA